MKRLNIGIDIDGTITEPYYWVDSINRHFNKNIQPEDITEYNLQKVFNLTLEDLMEHYKIYGEEMHARAQIRENAEKCIQRIANDHNIFYVTARIKRMENVTREWLQKHNLPSDNIYLLGSHDKLEKAKELRCDFFIEDRKEIALELSEAGIDVLLIDCNYNRGIITNEKIKRVYNWREIYSVIYGEY